MAMRTKIISTPQSQEFGSNAASPNLGILYVLCRAVLLSSIVLFVAAAGSVQAQEGDSCPCPTDGVQIGFQGTVCGIGNFFVSLNGEVATGNNIKCLGGELTFTSTNKAFVKLKPNQTYVLSSGTGICINEINFDVPV